MCRLAVFVQGCTNKAVVFIEKNINLEQCIEELIKVKTHQNRTPAGVAGEVLRVLYITKDRNLLILLNCNKIQKRYKGAVI